MNTDDARAWLADRVSRETMEMLEQYHSLLLQWQKTINLVAPSTLDSAWFRHFVDSAQLFDLAPKTATHWLDLGSGAGFPGLVIAAMSKESQPNMKVTFVESDIRKCGFMREAARKMGVHVQILTRRVEDIPIQSADVISARALSNLASLIDLASPHVSPGTCLLFPKGSTHKAELETVPHEWQSRAEIIQSKTRQDAVVIRFNALDHGNDN